MTLASKRSAAATGVEVLRVVRNRNDYTVEINGKVESGPLSTVVRMSIDQFTELAKLSPSDRLRARAARHMLEHLFGGGGW